MKKAKAQALASPQGGQRALAAPTVTTDKAQLEVCQWVVMGGGGGWDPILCTSCSMVGPRSLKLCWGGPGGWQGLT